MSITPEIPTSTVLEEALHGQEIEYVLEAARRELQVLLEKRSALLKRIATVRRTIEGLVDTFGDAVSDKRLTTPRRSPGPRQTGLTQACRTVLVEAGDPLTAIDVTERVLKTDASVLRHHKNAVSSVTTILRRLESYGEANSRLSLSGQRVWTWPLSGPDASKHSC